jgi:uncharacterized protein (DUF2164 family)
MAKISFNKEQKTFIVSKIQRYFDSEMSQEIGEFEAEFLLDFFSEQMGSYYYNEGLRDAQAILSAQIDNINESIDTLELSTEFD